MHDILDVWRAHSAMDLYLLNNLPPGGLDAAPASDERSVGQIFAHINDVRLRWMHNTAPELVAPLAWFERQPERAIEREQLQRALAGAGAAVEALIRRCTQAGHGITELLTQRRKDATVKYTSIHAYCSR